MIISGVATDAYLPRQRSGAAKALSAVLLTGKSSPAYIKKAMALRVSGYIVKPFTSELLVTRVRRALRGSVQRGGAVG